VKAAAPRAPARPAPAPARTAKAPAKGAAKAPAKAEAKAKAETRAKPEARTKRAVTAKPVAKPAPSKGANATARTDRPHASSKPVKEAKAATPAPQPLAPAKPVKAAKAAAPAPQATLAKSEEAPKTKGKSPQRAPMQKPSISPLRVASEEPTTVRAVAVAFRPSQRTTPTPIKAPVAVKPLSAPAPVAAEIVGEALPVPAYKGVASPSLEPSKLVMVGAIAGAFGVNGEVRVRAFTDSNQGVIAYGPLYGANGKVVLRPKTWREIKDGVAVSAAEVKTREQAQAMRGVRLFVPRTALPAPANDEFYIVDLLGCRAETIEGDIMGEVVGVWNFGAGDIVEVKPVSGQNERYSFTKDVFPVVDLPGRRVVIDPPPVIEPTN